MKSFTFPRLSIGVFQEEECELGPCVVYPFMDSHPHSNVDAMMSLPAKISNKLFTTSHVEARPYQLMVQNLIQDYPIINRCRDQGPKAEWVQPNIRLFVMHERMHKMAVTHEGVEEAYNNASKEYVTTFSS